MEASESVEKSRRKSTLESPSATAIGSPSTSSRSTSPKSSNGSMARLVPALHGIRFECGAGLGFRDRILSLVPGNEVIALAKRDPHRCLDEAEQQRSEEDKYELQSLMRIEYAVICLEKNKQYYTKVA